MKEILIFDETIDYNDYNNSSDVFYKLKDFTGDEDCNVYYKNHKLSKEELDELINILSNENFEYFVDNDNSIKIKTNIGDYDSERDYEFIDEVDYKLKEFTKKFDKEIIVNEKKDKTLIFLDKLFKMLAEKRFFAFTDYDFDLLGFRDYVEFYKETFEFNDKIGEELEKLIKEYVK